MENKTEVLIIMGSISDWDTMKETAKCLDKFGVSYEKHIASAHRTPEYACKLASQAADRGVKVIIAAAGGAAHLAGVLAAHSHLPIIGVPMKGWALDGLDSLLSTVQMPKGMPVLTLAIGKAGAINAGVSCLQILALGNTEYTKKISAFREEQTQEVLDTKFPE